MTAATARRLVTADAYLAALRSELGTSEHPPGSNHQEFSTQLGRPDEPWCADYLIAMADRVGLVLPSRSAYTPTLAQGFKDDGRWGTRPARGAYGFVHHKSLGRIAHVFAVEAVNQDGSFGTLEGNSNNGGSREGLLVCRHRRTLVKGSSSWVVGFGYPRYAPAPAPHPRPAGAPGWWTHTVKLGDVSQEVASICVRLKVPKRVTFDRDLKVRVQYVQGKHGLPQTGWVDLTTAKAIG